MARVNVYLPDDLAARAKAAGINVSALTQEAIRRDLDAATTNRWLARLADRAPVAEPVDHDTALVALDAVRAEATTRHG